MTQDKASVSQPDHGDVQWSAMQYVLGELSSEQAELFETAMADDVALCEAVIAATQLTCGIALACTIRPSTRPLIMVGAMVAEPVLLRRPAFACFGVFTAAVALILAVIAMVSQQRPRPGEVDFAAVDFAAVDDATADALVLLLDDACAIDMTADLEEWSVSDDSVSSLVAPEWLLTAVDLDAAAAADDHHGIKTDDEAGVY